MRHLTEYIFENMEFNEHGFSNFFSSKESFLKAIDSDNLMMNKIFKDPKNENVKDFINNIYDIAADIYPDQFMNDCTFAYAPLIFKAENGWVKLKRKYKDTELHKYYNKHKNIINHFEIGDGSLKGQTKGNEYEDIFVADSIEYINWIVNGEQEDYKFKMTQKKLFDNLFTEIKIKNKTLRTYIIDNKTIIDPLNCVIKCGNKNTSRNKNGEIIKFNGNKLSENNPDIKWNKLENSGDNIADVQYLFPNKTNVVEKVNISLKDKQYQLSNLGMSKNTMNIYPIFDEDIDDFNESNFACFCEYIGIDSNKIWNNVHNSSAQNESIKIDKKYYDNIANLFRIAIGANYYMVNSNGHITHVSFEDIDDESDIKISNAVVGYPSKSRKRINIDIEFSKNKFISSIQLAIRSKSGEEGNYGFVKCQLVWGKVIDKK